MLANGDIRNFRPHRAVPVVQEFRLYLRRLLLHAVAPGRTLVGHNGASGRAAFPITWCCCNWNMTPVSACIRPFGSMTEFIAW
jgi:capsular polysaccharide export protein